MYQKTCACGKSKKNFRMDIGDFFINTCCEDAGYDALGKLSEEVTPEPQTKPEVDVKKLKVKELKEIAKERGISLKGSEKKKDLIKLLS